jgi:hypothetical protein
MIRSLARSVRAFTPGSAQRGIRPGRARSLGWNTTEVALVHACIVTRLAERAMVGWIPEQRAIALRCSDVIDDSCCCCLVLFRAQHTERMRLQKHSTIRSPSSIVSALRRSPSSLAIACLSLLPTPIAQTTILSPDECAAPTTGQVRGEGHECYYTYRALGGGGYTRGVECGWVRKLYSLEPAWFQTTSPEVRRGGSPLDGFRVSGFRDRNHYLRVRTTYVWPLPLSSIFLKL